MAAPAAGQPAIAKTEARDLLVQSSRATAVAKQIELPIRANMIGFTYRGSEAELSVRTRRPGAGWSPWETVPTSDIGPDRWTGEGTDRVATEPLWVGLADRVAVRIADAAGVRDVRLHAINTLGNAHPRSWWQTIFGFLGSAPQSLIPRVPSAGAVPATPPVINRAGWGADERWRRCCPRYAPTVEVAMIHHTVNANNYSWTEAPALIRAIYRYHRFNLDYDDIAYNFIVDRFGRIFEGRFGGTTKPVVGAHTEGMNTKTTGVALLGTFSNAYPSGPMVVELMKLLAWKLDVHHIPAWGVVPMTSGGSNKLARGQTVNMNRISGHRDAQATDCPGTKMYYQLPRIRETVMKWGAPKFYMNSSPRLLRPDGDGVNDTIDPVRVWHSSSLNWKIEFSDASGNAKATVTGKGTFGEATWDGRDQTTGALAASGTGTIRVTAWDDSNKQATPAEIPLRIVTTHPAGTVLKSGSNVSYVDAGATLRSVPSSAVYDSWFGPNDTVATGTGELGRYGTGLPLGFRDGTLVRTTTGSYYFINAGQRRAFSSPVVFSALGFRAEAAIEVTDAEIGTIPTGPPIDDVSRHPAGSVVKDGDGMPWLIEASAKRPIQFDAVRRSWYRDAEVVPALAGDLALDDGDLLLFRPGSLLRTPSGHLWIVTGGTRRVFFDEDLFTFMGYSAKAVRAVTWAEIGIMPYGGTISNA